MNRQRNSWWDVPLLLQYKKLLAGLHPDDPPTLVPLWPQGQPSPARLALLPGSFNPITTAHLSLAERAVASGECDAVWFTISVRTVDKERHTGALLEDRLAVLHDVTRDQPALGVAITNRGLYVDQAIAAHTMVQAPATLLFIVGFDKIVQIFDPKYYDNRDAALDRLFRHARFLVAARDQTTERDLSALLERTENRVYARHITPLADPDDGQLLTISSTRIREQAADGSIDDDTVPAQVVAFINETGAYSNVSASTIRTADRYLLRAALLEALSAKPDITDSVDLPALVMRLRANTALASPVQSAMQTGDINTAQTALDEWLTTRHTPQAS